MADKLDISDSAVHLHSQEHGFVSELDVCVPYELEEIPPPPTMRIDNCMFGVLRIN